MAGLSKSSTGWVINFYDGSKKRRYIRLVGCDKRESQAVLNHIDNLNYCRIIGKEPSRSEAIWLDGLSPVMKEKLYNAGLISNGSYCPLLGVWLDSYIKSRKDVSVETVKCYTKVSDNLIEYFGYNCLLSSITNQKAREFDYWLKETKGLSVNTVGRRIGISRQFFNAAIRKDYISSNPFLGISAQVRSNEKRKYFVTCEIIEKVISTAPDSQWRALIALSRYGGLRVPSEIKPLKWTDFCFEEGYFFVHSQKTKRYGSDNRKVPIFPELWQHLSEHYELTKNNEFVFPASFASTPNLRSPLIRLIKSNGLKVWPKLFHNLRSSRETELCMQYPIHKVAVWIGHSPQIALKHYTQITPDDYLSASGITIAPPNAQLKAQPNGAETNSKETNTENPNSHKSPKEKALCQNLHIGASECIKPLMGDTGLEPVTPCL